MQPRSCGFWAAAAVTGQREGFETKEVYLREEVA